MQERLFAPGGVHLVGIRLIFKRDIKNTFYVWEKNDPVIENLLKQSNFFEGMKFWWIGLTYLYGMKNELTPQYFRISKKYGDLPIEIKGKLYLLYKKISLCYFYVWNR
tara:strand:+ start:5932 stop:6255 length:324 start_codon:yes stop_codon:yes gene_type:complete